MKFSDKTAKNKINSVNIAKRKRVIARPCEQSFARRVRACRTREFAIRVQNFKIVNFILLDSKMAQMTLEELNAHFDYVMESYKGDLVELSNAIGAARLGHKFGWRVLRIVISSKTYTKHQRVLGLSFKDVLPELTKDSERSAGYQLVVKLNNFWDVVRGVASIDPKIKTMLA